MFRVFLRADEWVSSDGYAGNVVDICSVHPQQHFAGNYLLHHGSCGCHYGMVAIVMLVLSMLLIASLKLVDFGSKSFKAFLAY